MHVCYNDFLLFAECKFYRLGIWCLNIVMWAFVIKWRCLQKVHATFRNHVMDHWNDVCYFQIFIKFSTLRWYSCKIFVSIISENIYHLIITLVCSLNNFFFSYLEAKKYLPYLFERESDRDNESVEVIIIFIDVWSEWSYLSRMLWSDHNKKIL
jgi:hypothetical protein